MRRGDPSTYGVPMRPIVARRPPTADLILAAFYALVIVAEAFTEPQLANPWVHAIGGGLAMTSLIWRRQFPLAVAVVVVLALFPLGANGGGLSIVFGLIVMAFTVGSELEGRRAWLGLVLLALPCILAVTIETGGLAGPGDIGALITIIVVPWLAGRTLRQRADHLTRARAYAERLEIQRIHEVERAAAEERIRLARELHDVVSHSISVLAIQAQAVRRRLHPHQVREAGDLADMEAAAREAMAEMRRLFGVLRDSGEQPSLAPQPGLKDLDRLVSQVRGTGMMVQVTSEGKETELPPGLDLAAYRIVQEALTNALRHSGGHQVSIRLDWHADELRISVTDDGRGMETSPETGHGLRGVRERAELYGGTLDVGPGLDGGTQIQARLPLAAAR